MNQIIFVILSTLTTIHYCNTMQCDNDESQLLEICTRSNCKQAIKWVTQHPHCTINCTNQQGQTPLLLLTVHSYSPHTINYFLEHGADKTTKDKQGNSLFSQIIYFADSISHRVNITTFYTLEDINTECKNLPESREYTAKAKSNHVLRAIIQKKLDGRSDINKPIASFNNKTALFIACSYTNIPLIAALLQKGARQDPYPYYILPYRLHWIVREIFNNGSFIDNAALISHVCCELSQYLVLDVTQLILKKYIECSSEQLLATPEACLWEYQYTLHKKPIANKSQWLLRILTLSKKEKTKLNLEIARGQWYDFS